jgi:hypothetical protein
MIHFAHFAAVSYLDFVSALFGIGMIGCFFVLVMTFYEDMKTILGLD